MYARYNYLGATTQSQTNILSDVAAILSGQTTAANLFGHINLSSAAVGITNASATVTWVGADDGSVVAARKNIEVGQPVSGVGIPAGATVATITNQTGFTISANATVTNAAAILTLGVTATLGTSTIGSTTKAISTTNASTNLTITGMCTATLGIVAVGMSVEGFGIPAGTTVSSITSANVLVMSQAATATVSPASIVLSPPGASVTCDATNTQITAAYNAAGWTLWDMYGNAGVANVWVLRAPLVDDSTQFKYIGLDVTTAGAFQLHNYEAWNQSTHAATNQSTAIASSAQQRITGTVAASMIVGASARYICLQSTTAAGIGASSSNEWTGVFERSRISPWDTVGAGYPPVVLVNGNSISSNSTGIYGAACCPRYKNPIGGDLAPANCSIFPAVMGGGSSNTSIPNIANSTNCTNSKVPDGLGGFYTPLIDLHFQNPINKFLGGSISTISDVWLGILYPTNLDTITANAKTYTFLQNNTTPASYGSLLIVKG